MSRMRNLVRGVASSYLQVAANIIYSLGSIPLALHYLSKEEFGLWALVTQVASYLSLIDLGMLASVSRVLIDHKDNPNGGEYGSVLKTSGLVFLVQGIAVALIGCVLSPFASLLLDLPLRHETEFRILIAGQSICLGLGFLTRFFSAPLSAHQRYDISNFVYTAQFFLMLGILWLGFAAGWGLYSMLFASFAAVAWTTAIQALATIRLRLFPEPGCWGRARMKTFRELFAFGKDVFLLAVGWQLVSASQVVIVGRVMGLDAAATWSICTKIFTFAQQIVWRITDFSFGAFSEMFVRGESDRLRERFKDTVLLTASGSGFVAVIAAVCNSDFVQLWTRGRVGWDPFNDMLMGILLIVYSVYRCHGGFVAVTKQIRFARFIYFLEGIAFVGTAIFAVRTAGFAGLTMCAIACHILLPGLYGVYRSHRYFGCSYREMNVEWLRPPLRFLMIFVLCGAAAWFWTRHLPVAPRLAIRAGTLFVTGSVLLWSVGLNEQLRDELKTRISRLFVRFFPRKNNSLA